MKRKKLFQIKNLLRSSTGSIQTQTSGTIPGADTTGGQRRDIIPLRKLAERVKSVVGSIDSWLFGPAIQKELPDWAKESPESGSSKSITPTQTHQNTRDIISNALDMRNMSAWQKVKKVLFWTLVVILGLYCGIVCSLPLFRRWDLVILADCLGLRG